MYDVCGPVDDGFGPSPPPWLGFKGVDGPGTLGDDVPPLDDGSLDPGTVGLMLPLDTSGGFEAVTEV